MNGENLPMTFVSDGGAELCASPADRSAGEQVNAAPAEDSSAAFRAVHQALRGRYWLAVALGMVLGAVGGVAAWMNVPPLFKSESLIRISIDTPRVMLQSPDYRPMDAYEAYMQSQQATISSRRVIETAMKDPLWKSKGYSPAAQGMDVFADNMRVEHKTGTEHIKVMYSSDDPVFASLAVQTVTRAYETLYNSIDRAAAKDKTQALESRRDELNAKLNGLESKMRDVSSEFGGSNVDKFFDAAVQRLTKVESALIDVRIAKALAQGSNRGAGARFSPQQIARFDPTMGRYTAEREQAETTLEQLRLRGYGEGHKQVIQAQKAVERIAERIRDYALEFQNGQSNAILNPGVTQTGQPGLVGRSLDELKEDETNLAVLNKEVKDQMASLGLKKMTVEAVRSETDKTRSELGDLTQKLASLGVDSGLTGRLTVVSNGEVPLAPYRDRRPHAAAVGLAGGLFLPTAALVAVGSIRRRYRNSADAADGELSGEHISLLGILPMLPDRITDPENAADAAQCVHQIRVILQVKAQNRGPMAYLVTSACPGEGKTSLAAALALSYAASGTRTLLIDADLIGQRLTRGYNMCDKPGLREIISGGNMGVGVYPTGVAGLSLLPAGVSDGRDACAVSGRVIKALLSATRKHYDVVMIDSGPILGSLEALVVAGVADGVILTISREQQKPLVDRALRQLRSVGARIAGTVFNKAEQRDFRRSVGVSSLRSVATGNGTGGSSLVKAGVTSTSGLGSLVDSVQTYLPNRM